MQSVFRSHCHNLISSSLTLHHPQSPCLSLSPLRSYSFPSISATHPRGRGRGRAVSWVGQVTDSVVAEEEDGPIELPPPTPDDPTPLQVAYSVALTGAISFFLIRSLRRRANRAKELKFRSTGATKSIKDEALDSLKAMQSAPIEADKPPSPVQAFLGGVVAGVIALFLYKFAVTVEANLNRQAISDNYSVRQITITIRTIVNGLCYLATFVFGINSVGLLLYSGQLAINSFMGESSSGETENATDDSSDATDSTSDGSKERPSSNDMQ